MELGYLFKLNDWRFKRFILIIISLQIALFGSIGLDLIGLPVPLLRQILGFITLSFIPGFLVLRIMKIHDHETIPTILYSLGISLAILMFSGFFINFLYPLVGFSKPITLFPLLFTITIEIFVLCGFAYFSDHLYYNPQRIDFKGIISPSSAFFCLLPLMAILGTYLMNSYQNNSILILLIIVIAFIPFLVISDRHLDSKLYPFAIMSISLALLFHYSLISSYVTGWDINLECYLSNMIINNGIWDRSVYGNLNAMLSLTILAPEYSIILSTRIEGIFKVVYPFFFALVPVGLFYVFQKQTNDKIAFFSSFFFMSIFTFFTELPALARQEIAELFAVLLILAIIDSKINQFQRSFFLIIFSASLIVSHYGLSYIFLLALLFILLLFILKNKIIFFLKKKNVNLIASDNRKSDNNTLEGKKEDISSIFILSYFCLITIWYLYTSSSSDIDSIVFFGHKFANNLFNDIFDPQSVQGLNILITTKTSLLREITKYLQLLMIFFMIVGFLVIYLQRVKKSFTKIYLFFSLFALLLCISGVTLPYIASSLNTSRLYQISLIFLSPFCVIGGIFLLNKIFREDRSRQSINKKNRYSLVIFSVILTIFLLLNSGWFFEVFHDSSKSIALNSTTDGAFYNEIELTGARWLGDVTDGRSISSDDFRRLLFIYLYEHQFSVKPILPSTNESSDIGYVFAGSYNIKQDVFLNRMTYQKIIVLSRLEQSLDTIYNSGDCIVISKNKPSKI